MILGDMVKTLRTAQYERIEIRDDYGNEILTCPASSEGVMPYAKHTVIEWFPHGAPNKDATFTVYVRSEDVSGNADDIRTCDNCKHIEGLPSHNGTANYSGACKKCVAKDMWEGKEE